jgi:hypothetical protein
MELIGSMSGGGGKLSTLDFLKRKENLREKVNIPNIANKI